MYEIFSKTLPLSRSSLQYQLGCHEKQKTNLERKNCRNVAPFAYENHIKIPFTPGQMKGIKEIVNSLSGKCENFNCLRLSLVYFKDDDTDFLIQDVVINDAEQNVQ